MDAKELETLWRGRLHEARLRLDFARNFLKEVQRDFPLSEPSPDGRYEYRRAIRLERLALREYRHVQRMLHDLQVNGTVPDEEEWKRRTAPGGGLM
jgi:hypothetical protein